MYKNKLIGVIIPAYNEADFVAKVIETVPPFVDRIYAINDNSTDSTLEIISRISSYDSRVVIINRTTRGGVGASILSGHSQALKDNLDIMAVLAGDGQMDPGCLSKFLDPVVEDRADYVKGDRLSKQENKKEMPGWRLFGNVLLTWLTRISSGYWHISDPQNGYTAISAKILNKLNFDSIEKGFAFENDMLVKLNVVRARVIDIQHPAVYRGQHSKIRYSEFIIKTSWILLKDFFWRIWAKNIKHRNIAYTKQTHKTEP